MGAALCPQAARAPLGEPRALVRWGLRCGKTGWAASRHGLEEKETEKAAPSQQTWPAMALWVWGLLLGWLPWSRKHRPPLWPEAP